jgi:Ca2+-binding EF-hand superfamily protein
MKFPGLLAAALLLASSGAAWAQTGGGLQRLRAMDANGDGVITRAEAESARQTQFARLDTDHDGYLSQAERSAAPGGGRMLNMVPDPDADGRISRAELMAAPYRVFDRLDANDDGAISAAEIEAARARAG